ncbi:alpha/beta hydrolase [Leptolyngbya sp. FACHB-261]|uniref:alpha/beta hydrolase n=1 Tax=Leptolyngbya sp. FACHB-261 TaxID=2692806 RepID=UPI0016880A4C|nr:alpha/beta hydrolase [Leptolyngbya sp. FACHB-261]MBD2102328.1 alpha/beta hydrolase [Leptolyngbya sp. FACHB-261]
MKEDILAKMTEDTRVLVQQMQAHAAPPPPDADPIQLARNGYRQVIPLAGPIEDVAAVEDYQVDSVIPTVPLRLYRPQSQGGNTSPLPALVYLHGGGFVSGGFDTHDRPLRALANASGYVIAAVEYRLAPESPFPAAPEDCFAALQWVIQKAEKLSIDASKIAIGGDSAGGLLATVVCLMSRDRKVSRPIAQVLIYPNTDLASDTPSWHELDFLHPNRSRENFVGQMAMYVTDPEEREQPYASPLRAPDVSGLPPALMITAELDPQRDEGEAYAQRLRDAGCLVTHTRYPGVLHGFFQMGGAIASGRVAIAEVAAYLRLRFNLAS